MNENELDKLLKQQLNVCKETTEFVLTSTDLLKRAITRIYELETLIFDLKQTLNKKKKKSKKKKDK